MKHPWDDDQTQTPGARSIEGSPVLSARQPTLRVVYTGGAVVGTDHPVGRSGSHIGRRVQGQTDVLLADDSRVSRQHALVIPQASGAVAVTNESTSGTFVNGVAVETAVLKDGDVLRVGDTFMVFRWLPTEGKSVEIPTLVGRSPAAVQLRAFIDAAGPTPKTVLILGETGSGKEVAAHAVHERSERKGRFVAVNCAAIPESLAEAQLFGHRAGAFTGATHAEPGLFRHAEGGTIFLDEVGELSLPIQAKLLRVLDERKVLPVGTSTTVNIDVRVVAATNRDLLAEVDRGRFRGDLYARLAELPLTIPPLRARREDILELLVHALGKDAAPLSRSLVNALLLHEWPFNVREVQKIAGELSVKGRGAEHLELHLVAERFLKRPTSGLSSEPDGGVISDTDDPEATDPMKQPAAAPTSRAKPSSAGIPTSDELRALLVTYEGRVSPVARLTGRSRTQVYRWAEEYGIDIAAIRAASE